MAKTETPSLPQARPRGRPALTEEQREQALAAAAQLLSEQGLDGMKARVIAQRAGLSVGSIYKLFGDIDELVRALNLRTYADFAAHHRAALLRLEGSNASVMDRLMALAGAYVDFVQKNGPRWRALLAFNRRQEQAHPASYLRLQDDLFGIVESVMCDLPGLEDEARCAEQVRALWASVYGIVNFTLPNSQAEDPLAETMRHIELIVGAVVRDCGG